MPLKIWICCVLLYFVCNPVLGQQNSDFAVDPAECNSNRRDRGSENIIVILIEPSSLTKPSLMGSPINLDLLERYARQNSIEIRPLDLKQENKIVKLGKMVRVVGFTGPFNKKIKASWGNSELASWETADHVKWKKYLHSMTYIELGKRIFSVVSPDFETAPTLEERLKEQRWASLRTRYNEDEAYAPVGTEKRPRVDTQNLSPQFIPSYVK